MPRRRNGPSLPTRLLSHLVPPLLLIWALGSLLALGAAHFFTQRAYDRSMLDDALVLAAHLGLRDGRMTLAISSSDLSTILYDQSEQVFFAVFAADGHLVAGHAGLRPPERPDKTVDYSDIRYHGLALRAVVLTREQPEAAVIVVAQTTNSRSMLLRRLVLSSLLPQGLLLAMMLWWLRRVIRSDLAPVVQLREWLEQRDANDLSPLPPELRSQAQSAEVGELGDSIDGLLARVEEGVSAQREFAGTVAHELRTPLAGVRAAAEYGLAQRDPACWREQLEAVLAAESRASHLIDQLLALALAEESKATLVLQPLRLDQCVRELLLSRLPRLDQAGIQIEANGLDDALTLRADRALVEGVLNNLLDNAVRYGRPARGAHAIVVGLQRRAGGVVLSVADRGPGLGRLEQEQLRQRWWRGQLARQLGQGSGLGLAIVGRYAELLGANLELGPGLDGEGLCASLVWGPQSAAQSAVSPAP